ncbi:MAG: (Fe-S)-binding protein [Candidatus Krumholzibacteriia bacterium]
MRLELFIPCYVEHLRPAVGLALARLLDRLGLDWTYPADQTCCGQPAYNAGHPHEALPAARNFLRRFENAELVLSPSGSCVAMLRRLHSLPGLAPAERDALAALGPRCLELSDFLVNRLGRVDLGARWPGRVAYQDSCHALRELGLADEPRRLLAAVEGLELVDASGTEHECCGFGGVYAVKLPELSVAQADERLALLAEAGADTLALTDVSCLLHLEGRARHLGRPLRALHFVEILAPPPGAGA